MRKRYESEKLYRQTHNEHYKELNRQRRKQRRELCLSILGGKCIKCFTVEDLEINHKDPDTKILTTQQIHNLPEDELVIELQKCELLCKACHIDVHSVPHGGGKQGKYGCKCEPCMERKRQYARDKYREKLDGKNVMERVR